MTETIMESEMTRSLSTIGVFRCTFVTLLCFVLYQNAMAQDCSFESANQSQSIWAQHPNVPGVEHLRAGRFTYTLSQEVVQRCLERQKVERDAGDGLQTSMSQTESRDACNPERVVCLKGVRFDPKMVKLRLLNVVREINENPKTKHGISYLSTREGLQNVLPVQYSVETLAEILEPTTFLIMNAGWNIGIDVPQALGFTVVDGTVLQPELYGGLSAIVCLDPAIEGDGPPNIYYHARDGYYAPHNWSAKKIDEVASCRDVLQVGPRIVEADNAEFLASYPEDSRCFEEVDYIDFKLKNKIGICESSLLKPARMRSILAVDTNKGAEGGRIYLLTTEIQATLFDLQWVLLRRGFYGDSGPSWAINLGGDKQSGMYYRLKEEAIDSVGNLQRSIATAIVLGKRSDE